MSLKNDTDAYNNGWQVHGKIIPGAFISKTSQDAYLLAAFSYDIYQLEAWPVSLPEPLSAHLFSKVQRYEGGGTYARVQQQFS